MDDQNQPSPALEILKVLFLLLSCIIAIYFSLLSVSIFHKFCYFNNVAQEYNAPNIILGKIGIIIFSLFLIGPAINAVKYVISSGKNASFKEHYWGSFSSIYLIFTLIRSYISGQTIPKFLPAFPYGIGFFIGKNKNTKLNWEKELFYHNYLL